MDITTVNKRICFYECDYKNRLKLSEILKFTAELAGYDYTIKGYTHQFLWDNGMVFLVSKVSFRIIKYPKDCDQVSVSTWEKGKKGALFLRGFQINDADGECMIDGTAGWVLVNPQTRHIIKPRDFVYKDEMKQILDRECSALPVGKIVSDDLKYVHSRKVYLSDLDNNGHVYNANYADIAVDAIFQQDFEKDVENFRINFISEAVLGDKIDVYADNSDKIRKIVVGKIEEKVCFEAEFILR